MTAKCLVLATILTLALPCALAEEVVVLGNGTASCGKWIEVRNDEVNRAVLTSWVLGFLSGSNWNANGRQARPADSSAVVAYIDDYCKNNPLHILALAAAAVAESTGGQKALHTWRR